MSKTDEKIIAKVPEPGEFAQNEDWGWRCEDYSTKLHEQWAKKQKEK